MLNQFGQKHKLPRSVICIYEDFHYMHGQCGTNNNTQCNNLQAWPCRSVFNVHDSSSISLNSMLSQTMCSNYKSCTLKQDEISVVKDLKAILFKPTYDSRSLFLNLRNEGCQQFPELCNSNCCECEYQTCSHYDHISYASQTSLQYYHTMCPLCVLKIGSSCNQFWGCCVVRMKALKKFNNLVDATSFFKGCYHFQHKRNYLDFCIDGNIFESSR